MVHNNSSTHRFKHKKPKGRSKTGGRKKNNKGCNKKPYRGQGR